MAGFVLSLAFISVDHVIFLILFPAIITVRGSISGILCGRLGTALHTGGIRPFLKGNSRSFYMLLRAAYVLTFVEMSAVGLVAYMLSTVLFKTGWGDLYLFILLPPLTGCLSILFGIPLTSILAFSTFRRGLDPDTVVYPMMSTVNDIVVTCIYYLLSLTLFRGGAIQVGVSFAALIFLAAVCLIFLSKSRMDPVFTETLREAVPVVLLCACFGIFGGLTLGGVRRVLEKVPGVLILYPAVVDALGDVGSIVGSNTTSRLHLGELSPSLSSFKELLYDILAVESSAGIVHTLFGGAAYHLATKVLVNARMDRLVVAAVLSNLVSFVPICLLAFLVAVLTFKRGLDPDNFVIPVETAVSDALGTLALSFALTVSYIFIV
ncbi:MAG: magnesium transporter [Candidatus Bathyarchaeia archaeon]